MDCICNNSAIFQQDDSDNVNVIVHGYGGVNGDVERMSKTTTSASGSNPRGEGKRDDDDDDNEVRMSNNNSSNEDVAAATTMQPSSLKAMMIVKGKRTRRHRLHFTYSNNEEEDADQEAAEQLDMANCLILLAQGQSPSMGRNELGLLTKLSSSDRIRRFSSENRRGDGSSSSMYECKTCNRTFPSFQALGGHRASHKKLKITVVQHDFTPANHSASDSPSPLLMPPSLSPLSLRLGNISYSRALPAHSNRYGNKVHECSICGAEFSSGQALGGHMRRHRGPLIPLNSSTTNNNNNPIANTPLSLMSTNAVESVDAALAAAKVNRINTSNNNGSLSLDLNLPASPSPDDIKFSLDPKQPQSHQRQRQSAMLFSTPALVDSFY